MSNLEIHDLAQIQRTAEKPTAMQRAARLRKVGISYDATTSDSARMLAPIHSFQHWSKTMPDADLPGLDPLSAPQPNPALQALAFLLGAWEMVLSNASFLPDQTTSVKGQLMVDWMQQGAYMIMLMGNPATPDARWLISRDGDAASYTMSYYDARQVARIYQMTYVDHVWKIWRDHPTFSQRFTAKVSADERVIAGHWEKSADGQTWERDFDVTYTKQRP